MFNPSKRLKTSYDKWNKLYWDGQLPHDTMVGWDDGVGSDRYGETNLLQHENGHRVFLIHLNPILTDTREIRDLTILHEMCHVRLCPYMKHGKRFNEEMLRIASRGAFYGIW